MPPPLSSPLRAWVALGHPGLSSVEQGLSSGSCRLADFGGPGSPLASGGLFIGVAGAGCLMRSHGPLCTGPRLLGGGWLEAGWDFS